MTEPMTDRAKKALEKHAEGYNCAQAVSCVFCDKTGVDEATMFRFTEGMGLGMGGMEGTCGAIGAAAVLSGLKNSTAQLDKPDSKRFSYEASKACLQSFKEHNGSVVCKDLKGVETGKVLRPCNDCIADAVMIIEQTLFKEESEH
ncbi:C-GCAxxG-C-C family protein [Lacrimispora defluvii]|uniref:C_GCAxxG_C_C family protein n=1 Tax=Lacrimispora defluvii TaxID=2719233 RepID=A0ABX1VVI2_9FIRM|nr:C-GCAxxG-C-C family protein [Lacrimispora defluvii]NNJ31400.1 C_GCAxxG_C_C family protein [Lacrimispora defluvii]